MMPKRRGVSLFLLLTTGLTLLAGPTATLTGRLTDPSGGVIAGCEGTGHQRGYQPHLPKRNKRGRSLQHS